VDRYVLTIIVFSIILVATFILELLTGSYPLGLSDLLGYFDGSLHDSTTSIVIDLRLRRLATAVLAGSILSLSTLVLQSVFRNPLASPFTLGLQHAASLGAGVAIMLLQAGSVMKNSASGILIGNPYMVSAIAFATTLAQGLLIVLLAVLVGLSVYSLILVSVMLSFLVQAVLYLMQYLVFNEIAVATLLFWSVGDLSRTNWSEIALMSGALLILLAYTVWGSMSLDLLSFSDELASSSGVNPGLTRITSIIVVSLAVGVTVSFTGIIGFAGLIAVYASRLLVGWSTRRLIPVSFLTGSLVMTLADVAGRVVLKPIVIPVGVSTSIIGVPLLLVLILGGRSGIPKD